MTLKIDAGAAAPQSHKAFSMKQLKRAAAAGALVVLAYLCVLAFPQPLFSHHTSHLNYEIWSDQPIPPQIAQVLDDATRRLRTSALHEPDQRFKIFFCNASWRLWLFSQQFSDEIGGNADTWLTRNVYIRSSDIAANRIHSPGAGPILDAAQRPLSYYIAHEITHIIESREFGRLMYLRYPRWLTEGYADYVGKGGDFDFDENRRLLARGDPLLDYRKSGLYRRFHLEVFYLLNKKGLTVRQVFSDPPREQDLLDAVRNGSPI
jgi:hypothetical protein